jgi:uncharacterized coiled-coil protein SlyX
MTEPTITVTPSRVSFFLALATVLGLAWSTITYVNRQDHRIATVETKIEDQRDVTKELVAEIKTLTINVARLSTILETATKQASASERRAETRGVVETSSPLLPHRGPSSARDRTNLPLFGAAQ